MLYQQQLLVELISTAIFNKTKMVDVKQKIDWMALYKEADVHQIAPLIFNVVKNQINGEKPSKELLEIWQNNTIVSGIRQTVLCEKIKSIFAEFNNCKIDYLPLKGLILRDLYPKRELRTMGDADILIHKNDFNRVKEVLEKFGYRQLESNDIHTLFYHEQQLIIEMHWSLIYDKYFNKSSIINNSSWLNAKNSLFYGIPIRKLSNEDMLLHLCIHMATHLIDGGFGFRQLCDFVLFVNNNKEDIKWGYFNDKAIEFGVNKFINILFDVYKKLFNLDMPAEFKQYNTENNAKDDRATDALINEIFKSGVFGGRDANQIVKSTAIRYHKNKNKTGNISKKDYFLALLFPSAKMYTNKYNYARKYPILTPFFWVHHFFNGIFRKEFLFKDKLLSVFKAPGEAQRKQELLSKLGLL